MQEIRIAKLEEAQEIFDILEKLERESYTLDLIKDFLSTKDSFSLVLTLDDQIIGILGAKQEGKNSAWIHYITIHEKYKGKGYGRQLITEFFNQAKKKNIKRAASRAHCKGFFEKFGFEEVGRIPSWYKDKDQVIMFKELE